MFENLQKKLTGVFKNLSGKGKLSEKNIKDAVREVKLSLLEADVHYKVVKELIDRVKEEAVGSKVLESLTPDQEFIRIVRDDLIELMGGKENSKIAISRNPGFIMLTGLQGSGKTTTAAKLANLYKKKGKNPLLVAADTYRPAAIDQLVQLGEDIGIPVFTGDRTDALKIVEESKKYAEKLLHDIVIVDTAGRLHIDEKMMEELDKIKKLINPDEILMVVDSMVGQDAVNSAKEFNDKLDLSGFVVSKLDGDSRGGVIISIRYITGKPVKLVGVGEKIDDLEEFYPDRYVGRILGMGDVLSFIDKVEKDIDKKKAEEDAERFMDGKFDLKDFLEQIRQIRKLGPLSNLLEMVPGVPKEQVDVTKGEQELKKFEAIINSMTQKERKNTRILTYSRKQRIAKGSGTTLQDINRLLKSYDQLKKTMKQMKKFKGRKLTNNLPF